LVAQDSGGAVPDSGVAAVGGELGTGVLQLEKELDSLDGCDEGFGEAGTQGAD